MNDPHRRYEILLPLRFNDGTPVPEELIGQTFADLERQYGALSWESQTIHGKWRYQGEAFRDDQVRVFVDVPDTPENRRFFERFKDELTRRFAQLSIRLTTYPVEVL
jgi:hypothetical protein